MALARPVYLDHHATTPLDPRVLERMLPALRDHFGNPASSGHAFGWAAARLVADARDQTAALVGCRADEIVFTSGATESINTALKGYALRRRPGRVVISAIEHPAVWRTAAALGGLGWEVREVGCGPEGVIDPDDVAKQLDPGRTIVSLIAAQNEIGTVQPWREIAAACRAGGAVFHLDAAQAVGKLPLDAAAEGLDMLSLSAHKLYGPKGIGALFVRRRLRRGLSPLLDGGGQEEGLRAGTVNVAGVAGLGEACRVARLEMAGEAERVGGLRDRLLSRLRAELDGLRVHGSLERRLPGNLNVGFAGLGPGALNAALAGIAVSSGAACSSSDGEVSPVLTALGVEPEIAAASLRIGVGRFNTAEEIDFAAGVIVAAVKKLRRG